jgi:DNA-binding transcriptional MerR regulator
MKIGELSRRSGVSIRMLRYYETEGLLMPSRTSGGYRTYDQAAEEALARIRLLSSAGLTLDSIRQLLPCVRSEQPTFTPCAELRAILRRQVELIDARVDSLDRSRRVLTGFLNNAQIDSGATKGKGSQ